MHAAGTGRDKLCSDLWIGCSSGPGPGSGGSSRPPPRARLAGRVQCAAKLLPRAGGRWVDRSMRACVLLHGKGVSIMGGMVAIDPEVKERMEEEEIEKASMQSCKLLASAPSVYGL